MKEKPQATIYLQTISMELMSTD